MALFTPSLGLFDTFHHGRLGVLTVGDGEREFVMSEEGVSLTFKEAWEPFRLENASDFQTMPISMVVWLLLAIIFIHVSISSLTLRLFNMSTRLPPLIYQGFYSILTPPLHVDWEFFYRQDGNKDVLKSWRRLHERVIYSPCLQPFNCPNN